MKVMGCLNSKEKPVVEQNNHYSWSDRDKVNPVDYTISNAKYGSFIKRPGDILGQQFIIESCEFCNIGLFDYINTITIDDCNNCSIFIGPTIGSVVLRNCISCRIMCCSQQFRARDCRNLEIFLYCATQPAIESCYDLTFGCFSAHYTGIEDQFKRANLCVLNNNWSNVYDFTVNDEEIHWNIFSNTAKAEDYFSGIPNEEAIGLSFNSNTSVVPKTLGSLPTAIGVGELVLVLIIGEQTHTTAMTLIREMENESEIFLMKTKEFYAITAESQLMFGVESNQMIVALLYKGRECVKKSQDIGKGLSGLNPVVTTLEMLDSVKRICVIGAGAAGLPAIKACLEEGLEVVCYEKTADIGGLWNYRPDLPDGGGMVHKTTIANSSKEISAFSDFPFPKEYPNYITHKQLYEYFKQYAKRFDLLKHILFEHSVEKVEKNNDYETSHRFKVTVFNIKDNSRQTLVFDGVMICSGQYQCPRWPDFAGQQSFKGKMIHSRDMPPISQLTEFEDKTALVVGAGNSGCDSAVELSNICNKTYFVLRKGSWVIHRVAQNGMPIDIGIHKRYLNKLQNYLPFSWICWYFETFYFNERFNHRLYGIQPNHRCFAQTLIVNENLPSKILSGKIIPKRIIERFTENGVIFNGDKTEIKCDLVVMATGYHYTLPMIDKTLFEISEENSLEFYKQVFPKQLPHYSLAVIGAVTPNGGIFPLFEMQSRWYAMLMTGKCQFPNRDVILADIAQTIQKREQIYYKSSRNNFSVDWISYMDQIADMIGVKPDLREYLLSDTKLFMKLVFGTCLPYQYRLKGNHCWSGARDAIIQSDYRIRYPLNPNEAQNESYFQMTPNLYRIVFTFILFLFVFVLLDIFD